MSERRKTPPRGVATIAELRPASANPAPNAVIVVDESSRRAATAARGGGSGRSPSPYRGGVAAALSTPDEEGEDIRTRKTVQELDARAALDALAVLDRARDDARGRAAVPVARPPSARPASGTGREDATSGVYYEVYRQDGAPQEEQSAPSSQSRPVWSTMAGKGTRPPARPQGPPGDALPPGSVTPTVSPARGAAQSASSQALAPLSMAPVLLQNPVSPAGLTAPSATTSARGGGEGPMPASAYSATPPRADLGPIKVVRVALGEGEIDARLHLQRRPDSPQAAAFRVLRYRVEQAAGQVQTRVLALAAPRPGQGATTAAVNLALALSECDRARVCLVEGNLRRPALARLLNFQPPQCLAERLAQDRHQPLWPWEVAELSPSLHVLAVRPGGVSQALVDGPAFAACIESLRRGGYRYIVIDGPQVLGIADMNLIEEVADQVLLVARGGVTHAADLRVAGTQLARTKLLGVVLLDGEGG